MVVIINSLPAFHGGDGCLLRTELEPQLFDAILLLVQLHVSHYGYQCLSPQHLNQLMMQITKETKQGTPTEEHPTKMILHDQLKSMVFIELIEQEHLAEKLIVDVGHEEEDALELFESKKNMYGDFDQDQRHISRVVSWVSDHGGLFAEAEENLLTCVYNDTDKFLQQEGYVAVVLCDSMWTYVGHVYAWFGSCLPNEVCFMGIRKRLTLLAQSRHKKKDMELKISCLCCEPNSDPNVGSDTTSYYGTTEEEEYLRAPTQFAPSLVAGVGLWANQMKAKWITVQRPLKNMVKILTKMNLQPLPIQRLVRNYAASVKRMVALATNLGVFYHGGDDDGFGTSNSNSNSNFLFLSFQNVLNRWAQLDAGVRKSITQSLIEELVTPEPERNDKTYPLNWPGYDKGGMLYECNFPIVSSEDVKMHLNRFDDFICAIAWEYPCRDIKPLPRFTWIPDRHLCPIGADREVYKHLWNRTFHTDPILLSFLERVDL